MKTLHITLAFLLCCEFATAAAQKSDKKQDNSRENKHDRDANHPSADQQKMNAADEDLTRKIRQSIMADKSLSTYAQNLKIISRDGKVTMKGPVRSEDEKRNVMAKAVEVAGHADRVINQITVTP